MTAGSKSSKSPRTLNVSLANHRHLAALDEVAVHRLLAAVDTLLEHDADELPDGFEAAADRFFAAIRATREE